MAQNSVYPILSVNQMEIYPHCLDVIPVTTRTTSSSVTFLQRFDIAAGEGDANAVNGHLSINRCLASVLKSLQVWKHRVTFMPSMIIKYRLVRRPTF